MSKKKKTNKKPQNKNNANKNNAAQDALQSKPYSVPQTKAEGRPLLLRIFVLALVALMVLGVVVAAIAQ